MLEKPNPITFVTLDGAERQFCLIENLVFINIARRSAAGNAPIPCEFLWEALLDKSGLTESAFYNLLPLSDSELIDGLIAEINREWMERNKSKDKRNERFRPTKAAIHLSTGSGSPPSGE